MLWPDTSDMRRARHSRTRADPPPSLLLFALPLTFAAELPFVRNLHQLGTAGAAW